MSFVKNYVHVVWSTKYRMPVLIPENRKDLYKHIINVAKLKGIEIDCVNGWSDHIHLLIKLHQTQSVSDVVHAIKGESSYWFNNLYEKADYKIKWQKKYFCGSVNYKEINTVRAYIKGQEQHHLTSDFVEEFHLFLEENGFSSDQINSSALWD